MAKKYQNKYRIESTRLQNWDYGWNAAYFVTICTANMAWYFGDVVDDEMDFSEMGKMADECWLEIPEHFPFVKLDVHQVMPNHVHGIIIIDKPDGRYAINRVSTVTGFVNEPNGIGGFAGNKNPMLNDNLSRILRWYKGRVTFELRKNHPDFTWQSRFHDHIIRDNASFKRIQQYIINNPKNWNSDKFNKGTKK